MDTEYISMLLGKIEAKQFAQIGKHFAQHNKRIKVPGFTALEKAPRKLIANTARTNQKFRQCLLVSIAAVILDGEEVTLENGIAQLLESIPCQKRLGLAAYLLLEQNEEFDSAIEKLISDCPERCVQPVPQKPAESDHTNDKREEKFREKYLKLKAEMSHLQTELEEYKSQKGKDSAEIERLQSIEAELIQQSQNKSEKIEELTAKIVSLQQELQQANARIAEAPCVSLPQADIRIFAPNCADILEKYEDILTIDFNIPIPPLGESAVEGYGEIWVLPNVLSFGMVRFFTKLWNKGDERVHIFQSVGELLERVQKMTGRK